MSNATRAVLRFTPATVLCFFATGLSFALSTGIFIQKAKLTLGNTPQASALLLTLLFAGLCAGSFICSRIAARLHPRRTFAALAVLLGLVGTSGVVASGVFFAFHLLLAGLLAGALIPLMPEKAGAFLGTSLLGVAAGIFAGVVLPHYAELNLVLLAAAVLQKVAALVVLVASGGNATAPEILEPHATESNHHHPTFLIALPLFGMTLLAALLLWMRPLTLLFGDTIQTQAILLGIFAAALGLGAGAGTLIARATPQPAYATAWCLALWVAGIGWAEHAINSTLPNWPILPGVALNNTFRTHVDILRAAWAILPGTLCAGGAISLALATFSPRTSPARSVGTTFAVMTASALAGLLFFGQFAVTTWGTQGSVRILMILAAIAALTAVIAASAREFSSLANALRTGQTGPIYSRYVTPLATLPLVLACVITALAIVITRGSDKTPWQLVAFGRNTPQLQQTYRNRTLLEVRDARTGFLAVTRDWDNTTFFHLPGIDQISTSGEDMRLQLLMGHLPAMLHGAPKKVLVLGCGTGVTAGAFLLHRPRQAASKPDEAQIVICEPEPLTAALAYAHFHSQNNEIVTRKTNGDLIDSRLIEDDARHFLHTTADKFDIIAGNLVHPSAPGAAAQSTLEFFETLKSHLNPGGIVVQWVPLYDTNTLAVQSELRTFFEAFPQATVWNISRSQGRYDLLLLGGTDPIRLDAAALKAKMSSYFVKAALTKVGIDETVEALKYFAGTAQDLKPWVADAPLNRDTNLRLQYLVNTSLGENSPTGILAAILRRRTFPAAMVNLTADQRLELERAWSTASPAIKIGE